MHDLIDPLSLLSVRGLLSKDEYLIPMYQRNYAWGEGEINQLIQDMEDFSLTGKPYYIGTLVVFDRDENGKNVYEVIGEGAGDAHDEHAAIGIGRRRLGSLAVTIRTATYFERGRVALAPLRLARREVEAVNDLVLALACMLPNAALGDERRTIPCAHLDSPDLGELGGPLLRRSEVAHPTVAFRT